MNDCRCDLQVPNNMFHHDRGRLVLPIHRGAVNNGVRHTPPAGDPLCERRPSADG